jgi:predicted dehydrogenase
MGVYAIARLVSVLGTAKRVMGMTGILDKPSEVEDTASLLIQFESGALATAETGWTDGARTARLAVHGTFGRCEQDGFFAPKVTMYQQASKTREDIPPKKTVLDCSKTPVIDPHAQWVECIRTNTRPKLETARAARHITEIMLAGLESGKTGRAVEIKSTL